MKKELVIAYVLLFTSITTGCKKKQDIVIDPKTDYAALQLGHWVEYNVDSFIYNDFTSKIDSHFLQIRELVADTFTDNTGSLAYKIERYERADSNHPWDLRRVWSAKLVANRLERMEENLRYVKLIFPPALNQTWKGNAFINVDPLNSQTKYLDNWDYEYVSVDAPSNLGTMNFANTVTVLQHEEEIPGLERNAFKEIYARKVGLIYSRHTHLEKQPGDTQYKSGFDVECRIMDWEGR